MTGNAILAVTAARLGIFLGACAVVGLCVFLVCYSLTKRLKVTEIFADNVQLLGGRPNAREEQPQRPQTTNPRQAPKYKPQPAAAEGADDLPFD